MYDNILSFSSSIVTDTLFTSVHSSLIQSTHAKPRGVPQVSENKEPQFTREVRHHAGCHGDIPHLDLLLPFLPKRQGNQAIENTAGQVYGVYGLISRVSYSVGSYHVPARKYVSKVRRHW